ncbi:MAG TPA: PQQ-binding-like beta-propeller repeat protein [Terriglobia bacterium]|nr:PQQ-binding-like beta-propeller repeat protein [Terriglobia bacterium]
MKIFASRCAGCHGLDAHGTDQGPALAGNAALRGRSLAWLRNLIHSGIPTSGMPAFSLPESELEDLAVLVHSLNSPAAEQAVPGDREAGERFFFGKGQCSSCHMVSGRGRPVGPDLSNVAHELTVDELRQALLQPSAQITPGYESVIVELRNGRTVHGFARSGSNFEIVLQDLSGDFHPVDRSEISGVREEKQSPMPPVQADPGELQNLVAYLARLTGVKPGAGKAVESASPGGIPFSRILHPGPGDWLTYNGDLSGNRYSQLHQINTTNVDKLVLKWIFSVPLWKQFLPDTSYFAENMKYFGLEVTPIVADGIMYITGPQSAFALDARTGQMIWQYSRPRPLQLFGDASLGTNRGVAILGNNLFMTTPDAHLIALSRTTGKLVWDTVMPDEPMHYGSTVAPLVVKDAVVAGVSGGDWGIRGFVAAYKASSGERLWRRWTVPAKGEPGAESWGGNPGSGAGGATWLTGSYDPEMDTLYWTTGNPFPDSDDSSRPGDNLYTDCILALDPGTGKVKWSYQVTPHDVHDWDANAPLVLVDTKYQGRERKLLLHADKNGFLYVLDRTSGQVLLAKSFVKTTWASTIGPDGRPQLLPESALVCPDYGTNWNATAFSPLTHLYYLMAREKCEVKLSAGNWRAGRPREEPGKKFLRALDIETGKVVWEVPQIGPIEGKREAGVLATAGGILVYGDPGGNVVAVDQRNGKTLWHFATSGENKASPMTYGVGGKQFFALAVGPNILCFGLP